MFATFKNAWKIEDLRKKLLYTLLILVIFRLGVAMPVPFLSREGLAGMLGGENNMLGFLNMMTGGAFSQATLFALSVTPYINATIIMQLLTVALPPLERMAKEGMEGRRKINRISRYVGCGIALFLSIAYYFLLKARHALVYTEGFSGFLSGVVIVLAYTAGSMLIMWLGEQIDKKGIGNGISMLIFAGIVSRFPASVSVMWAALKEGVGDFTAETAKPMNLVLVPLIIVLALVTVWMIVILTGAERRIPVQYAKRVVGRKQYGGQATHIPLKVNMSGVMPIIFASAFISIPGTILQFFPNLINNWFGKFLSWFGFQSPLYAILYVLLILAFNYFYVAIQYNPIEIANNLRQNNGAIPGIRPGKPTSDFITKALGKITFIGAIFLALVAVTPILVSNLTGIPIHMGGTSLLIVVGVALDTSRSLESYMLMRHHKGFLE